MLTAIYVILTILGLSEAFLSFKKRSDKGTRKSGKDRLSLIGIWVTILVSIFFAIVLREREGSFVPITAITVGGVVITFLGSVLRWSAIHQLKEGFTVDVSIVAGHQLKTDGLFKTIRHPSYTGLLMNYLGIGIAMDNTVSLMILSIPLLIVILYRIRVEESLLTTEFGKQYTTYMNSTKRIIPFVY